ncbi:MAG: hypothetical protein ACYYKD_02355 [Rhodospirillales bacterium]
MTEPNNPPPSEVLASAEEDTEALPPQIKRLLESQGIDLNDPGMSGVLIQAVKMSIFSGPLPSPQTLAEYKAIDPELLDLIKGWTTGQMNHRMALEREVVSAETKKISVGQRVAGAVAIFGLAMAAVVGIWGNPATAVAIAAFAVGGPAVVRLFSVNAARTSSDVSQKEK